jgi:hypothetical protein
MYNALNSGNSAISTHNVKTVPVAMDRAKALAAMCFLSTGPKMIWQFGEMGFDFHINRCPDGTIGAGDNCRTDSKPLPWVAPQNYDTQPDRLKLRKAYSEIVKLKTTYDTFGSFNTFVQSSQGGNQYFKQLKQTSSPYTATPTSGNNMNVVVIANFDVVAQNVTADFHHTGTWYDFFSGSADAPYEVTGSLNKSINLKAGEFRIFTNFPITAPEAELTAYALPAKATGVTATAVSDAQIKIDWTDASGIETGYRIERSTTLNGTYTQAGANLPAGTVTYTDSGLSATTQYFYRVVTLSANGNKNTAAANATTLSVAVPAAPTNLQAVPKSDAKAVQLTWTDAATNETGYRVERGSNSIGPFTVITTTALPANTTTYTDNDATLNIGTEYFYRVCAVLGSQSACSTVKNATVTSVENRIFESSILLYPNPAQNTVWVKFENRAGKVVDMRIIDLRGKEVRILPATTEEVVELSIANLPKGTYMLELRTEKGTAVKRIVKN